MKSLNPIKKKSIVKQFKAKRNLFGDTSAGECIFLLCRKVGDNWNWTQYAKCPIGFRITVLIRLKLIITAAITDCN